jgi:hypothetical protein
MASRWLSNLLAVEIAAPARASRGSDRGPAIDPRDQHRQSVVGCAPYPLQTAQAWDRHRPNQRRQIYGAEEGTSVTGWRTFLRNHADGIAAIDLFVVPTVSFRLLYGLLIAWALAADRSCGSA